MPCCDFSGESHQGVVRHAYPDEEGRRGSRPSHHRPGTSRLKTHRLNRSKNRRLFSDEERKLSICYHMND
jgi:hypothetical protein